MSAKKTTNAPNRRLYAGFAVALSLSAMFLAASLPAARASDSDVSRYEINGRKVYSGMTARDIRRIAGEPVRIAESEGRHYETQLIYLCQRSGVGPCRTVKTDGGIELVLVLRNGRLDRAFFKQPDS